MTATLETITLAGGNYRRNGSYNPPSVTAALSDGRVVYLGGSEVKGFRGAADAADARGIDTATFRAKLENWVKTGKFELESEAQN
jgi:hypothetical protein